MVKRNLLTFAKRSATLFQPCTHPTIAQLTAHPHATAEKRGARLGVLNSGFRGLVATEGETENRIKVGWGCMILLYYVYVSFAHFTTI